MIKRVIKFTNYNGEEREMVCHFHLNKAEIAELEVSEKGGLVATIEKIVEEEDNAKIVELFKRIILMSYGVKSADGDRFIKTDEQTLAFSQTEAFSELFMELASSAEAASAFVNGILPQMPTKPQV